MVMKFFAGNVAGPTGKVAGLLADGACIGHLAGRRKRQ
jgi:hypothetical protein